MPDVTTLDTTQLLAQIGSGILNGNQQAALNEMLNHRIIVKDDPDDVQIGGENSTRGGVRPKHQPLVP